MNNGDMPAMAMQGMCSNAEYITTDWKDIVAKEAAYMADALLAELAKQQETQG